MKISNSSPRLTIAIENDMLCGSAFFSVLKAFISRLEELCAQTGVCSVANIELGETVEVDGRNLTTARFDVRMENGRSFRVSTTARTLDDAIANAMDECAAEMLSLRENRA